MLYFFSQNSPVLLCITLCIGCIYTLFGKLQLLRRMALFVASLASFWCILPAIVCYAGVSPIVVSPGYLHIWNDACFKYSLDGISLVFMIMTSFIVPISLFASEEALKKNTRLYIFLFLLLELFLMLTFLASNILVFYFFFESTLAPMFFLILGWGTQVRRVKASYYLYLYTLAGSLLLLLGILFVRYNFGVLDMHELSALGIESYLSAPTRMFLWLAIFIGFAVKIPVVPFHLWLPEAHVEAPAGGSILLAGVLLKLGAYGFIRLLLAILPATTVFFTNFIYLIAGFSVVVSSCIALRQTDVKRLVAYTSIAHMNVALLGLFSWTYAGLLGSMFIFVAHAFVSSALFFLVGVLYDRYGTRLIDEYGGIAQTMPLASIALFLFSLANISFPPTLNFVGELLVFLSLVPTHFSFLCGIILVSLASGTAYSIWLYNRICFGPVRITKTVQDLEVREILILFILFTFTLGLGLCPWLISMLINQELQSLLWVAEARAAAAPVTAESLLSIFVHSALFENLEEMCDILLVIFPPQFAAEL